MTLPEHATSRKRRRFPFDLFRADSEYPLRQWIAMLYVAIGEHRVPRKPGFGVEDFVALEQKMAWHGEQCLAVM